MQTAKITRRCSYLIDKSLFSVLLLLNTRIQHKNWKHTRLPLSRSKKCHFYVWWISGYNLPQSVGRYAVDFSLEYRWATVNGVVIRIEPKFSKWLNSDVSDACKNLSSPLRSSLVRYRVTLYANSQICLNIKSEYLIAGRVYIFVLWPS